jgi:HSP20 family molecular chaperone IbpA
MFFNLRRDLDRIFDIPIINVSDPFEEIVDMRSRLIDAFDNNFPQLTDGNSNSNTESSTVSTPSSSPCSSGNSNTNTNSSIAKNDNSNIGYICRWHPRCDAHETETEFIISAELPGLKKEEVNIEYDNDRHILSISGEVYNFNFNFNFNL